MALKLDVLANTRQFIQEMDKSGASVEDITDALDELQRQGEKGTERLESSFKELSRQAKKTEADVKDVGDKGFQKAGQASGEFKQEALANFSEVTSSFDGSMASIGDLAQGTLGGLAASLPGIGIGLGVAAAAIGGITAHFTELQEKATETKNGIINDFLEVGDALDEEAVRNRVRDLLGTEETRKQAELLAQLLGVTVGEAVLGLAGDFDTAGFSAQQAKDAIALAPGDVSLDTLERLSSTLQATNDGFRIGAEVAKAQQDAVKKQADQNVADLERVQAAADKLKNPFALSFQVDTSGIDRATAAYNALQARASRGINIAFNNTGRQLLQ